MSLIKDSWSLFHVHRPNFDFLPIFDNDEREDSINFLSKFRSHSYSSSNLFEDNIRKQSICIIRVKSNFGRRRIVWIRERSRDFSWSQLDDLSQVYVCSSDDCLVSLLALCLEEYSMIFSPHLSHESLPRID